MKTISGKELAEELTDFVNSYNTDKHQEFIDAFCNQHRTLQQSAFGLMLKVMERIASPDYRTDGRNEDSKKVAQTLVEGFRMAQKAKFISEGTSEKQAASIVDDSNPSQYLGFI